MAGVAVAVAVVHPPALHAWADGGEEVPDRRRDRQPLGEIDVSGGHGAQRQRGRRVAGARWRLGRRRSPDQAAQRWGPVRWRTTARRWRCPARCPTAAQIHIPSAGLHRAGRRRAAITHQGLRPSRARNRDNAAGRLPRRRCSHPIRRCSASRSLDLRPCRTRTSRVLPESAQPPEPAPVRDAERGLGCHRDHEHRVTTAPSATPKRRAFSTSAPTLSRRSVIFHEPSRSSRFHVRCSLQRRHHRASRARADPMLWWSRCRRCSP